jgi:hypothetical protein
MKSSQSKPLTGADDRRLSLSDPNLRSCFICLLNSEETPNATWVNPCPCTLEAHEPCLLRWVAESEASPTNRRKLRCPACHAKIVVVEPRDAFIKFRERLHRSYSRASPWILLCILNTAGSGGYGLMSLSSVAGLPKTLRWLGLFANGPPTVGQRVWSALKFTLLASIAPILLFHRAFPEIMVYLGIPAATVVSFPPRPLL